MSLNSRCKRWGLVLLLCTVWSTPHATGRAATPVPPPEAVKQFDAAVQSQDLQSLLAVVRRIGQQDTKEAVLAIAYAGLAESVLVSLSAEQTQQVLQTAQEVLTRMTDTRAWKATYKATYKHPDWRVRVMLLDVVRHRLPDEKRAEKAVIKAIGDGTDAVAIKAIEMAGEFNLKRTVPKLMQMVIAKWGQHVGVSAAKATLALEKITFHRI
ncbi:hypothetical protein [Candidatus Entotheonella palauensis]|uniref:hypothetical protein n=1 Tax=Candidatus Entotheonella palauensis TaxID=93172 RepID=UPI0011785642|nr:hypothetical protein [Candidatus Entotheonella palauensis]